MTLATLYTHFTAFFLLLFEGLVVLAALLRSRRREALVLIGLAGVLAVPLVVYALSRAQQGIDPVFGFRPLDSMVAEVWGTFIVGRTNDLFQPWWVVLPGVLMFAIGLIGGLLNKSRRLSTAGGRALSVCPVVGVLRGYFSASFVYRPASSDAVAAAAVFAHGLWAGLALVALAGHRNGRAAGDVDRDGLVAARAVYRSGVCER